MYYNELPIEKTDDVTREQSHSPDIYIDCAPADDANGESIIQYIKKPFASESLKESVDRLLIFLLNVLIVFVVVYFLYFKLPSYMKLSSASNSNSS